MPNSQTDNELQRLLNLCASEVFVISPTDAHINATQVRQSIWSAIKSAYEYGALNAQERRQAYEEELSKQGVTSAELERRIASVAMRRVQGDKWHEV